MKLAMLARLFLASIHPSAQEIMLRAWVAIALSVLPISCSGSDAQMEALVPTHHIQIARRTPGIEAYGQAFLYTTTHKITLALLES